MVRLRHARSVRRNIHGIHEPDGTGRGDGYHALWTKPCLVAGCEEQPVHGYPYKLCARHIYEIDRGLAELPDTL